MKASQLAINSVSTRGANLPDTLAAYANAGFKSVEFCLPLIKTFIAEGGTVEDVIQLQARNGIRCIGGFEEAVQAFSPGNDRARNHQLILENARLIADLGGNTMVVGTDGPPETISSNDALDTLARTFRMLAHRVRPTGVTLCIEFNWSPIVKSLCTAVEVARRSGAENVGVVFDPAHYHCTPTKFDQINARNVPYIRHVHLNDMRDKPGEFSHCNTDRVLPGQGIIDLGAIIQRLEVHGYQGMFSIELFSEELWQKPVCDVAHLLYESLIPLTEEPPTSFGVSAPPPPAATSGELSN